MDFMRRLLFLLFFITVCAHVYPASERFTHKIQAGSNWLHKTVMIDSYVDNEKVGFIAYDKIAIVPLYVIHSFYIYPPYRNKGYGRRLLNYACEHLKLHGANKIYLQPGPFELTEDGYIDNSVSSSEVQLQWLVNFYKKHQFVKTNKALSYCAALLYKCMHIDENADYLMVKDLK